MMVWVRTLLVLISCAWAACASDELLLGERCARDDLACTQRTVVSDASLDGQVHGMDASCSDCADASTRDASLCVPGMYVGDTFMTWTPGSAGICYLVTGFSGSGGGRWAMWLEPSAASDTKQIKVSGCLEIMADAKPDAGPVRPIRSLLNGTMQCDTGNLSLDVMGSYRSVSFCDLGVRENDYFFRGPALATFDPVTRSFVNGTADLREPPVAVGKPGGEGTWQATLLEDAGAYADGGFLMVDPASCLAGLMFPYALFDAGAP